MYYLNLHRYLDITIPLDRLMQDFQCARVVNYAEIVVAHLKPDWPQTPWYQVNLHALFEAAELVSGMV